MARLHLVVTPSSHTQFHCFRHSKKQNNVVRTGLPTFGKGYFTVKAAIETSPTDPKQGWDTVPGRLSHIYRSDFPDEFLFGAGTSALQTEGAWEKDGKGPSVWDHFLQQDPSKLNINVAIDSYHLYPKDIELLKAMGMTTYRFSISWPRIFPKGVKGGVNELGIRHYLEVFETLKANGITPFVTLFHFDWPQALEFQYGGPLSRNFIDDFVAYCDVCFERFGKYVKYWTTMNEPNYVAQFGYDNARFPPGRSSIGNSATEPHIVNHTLILAHAAASQLYKNKYKDEYGGKIGIVLATKWYFPQSPSNSEDIEATERLIDFDYGCYLGPLLRGEYPKSMKYLLKDRLPVFDAHEKKMIMGSIDFIGVNYYTSSYVRHVPIRDNPPTTWITDSFAETLVEDTDGKPIGELAEGSTFIRINPKGLKELLLYLHREYQVEQIIVTENGVSSSVASNPNELSAYRDTFRKRFIEGHLVAVKQAMDGGANVTGYYYWSLLDSFELSDSYNQRYGLNFTDFETKKRADKRSAEWFYEFLCGDLRQRPI